MPVFSTARKSEQLKRTDIVSSDGTSRTHFDHHTVCTVFSLACVLPYDPFASNGTPVGSLIVPTYLPSMDSPGQSWIELKKIKNKTNLRTNSAGVQMNQRLFALGPPIFLCVGLLRDWTRRTFVFRLNALAGELLRSLQRIASCFFLLLVATLENRQIAFFLLTAIFKVEKDEGHKSKCDKLWNTNGFTLQFLAILQEFCAEFLDRYVGFVS